VKKVNYSKKKPIYVVSVAKTIIVTYEFFFFKKEVKRCISATEITSNIEKISKRFYLKKNPCL
jgi:hypothetical protein